MPEMGEGVTDATVMRWLKQEGDSVEQYEPLVEVNTDKVDTEVPSPVAGTVLKIGPGPDTVVAVDELLCWIGEPGEEVPADAATTPAPASTPPPKVETPKPAPSAPKPVPTPATPPTPRAVSIGTHLKGSVTPLAARIAAENKIDPALVKGSGPGGMVTKQDILTFINSGGANAVRGGDVPAPTAAGPRSTFISPMVARLAAENNIDVRQVPGTGKDGRITKLDIERWIAAGGISTAPVAPARPAAPQPHPAYAGIQAGTTIKHTPVRRSIAKHMLESKQTSPHVSTFIEVDMSKVWEHRTVNKATFASQGVKLTFTAYFVSAVVTALQAYPLVNSSWSEDGLILHSEINIGMAVSLDADGLIVPVIKRADQLDLLGTARAVNDLAERARSKSLQPDEVRGGTFTITNHGTSGSLFATPIINQPQCGILGAGTIQKRPVVVDDAIAIRPMVYLSLTFDHRILDGAIADYFLAMIKHTLEEWA
jgi:2-oxoglutarate dehydrogenase E2 component (dihydrolipoamide succinyltransferase)